MIDFNHNMFPKLFQLRIGQIFEIPSKFHKFVTLKFWAKEEMRIMKTD